jgi:hypothetical protein
MDTFSFACGCAWDSGTTFPCAPHAVWGYGALDEPEPDDTQQGARDG